MEQKQQIQNILLINILKTEKVNIVFKHTHKRILMHICTLILNILLRLNSVCLRIMCTTPLTPPPPTQARAHASRHDNDRPHQAADENFGLADERIWRGVETPRGGGGPTTFAHV